jgi:hypothetical protein
MARTHNLTGLSTTPGFGQGEAALLANPQNLATQGSNGKAFIR